jgi:DNA polymerase I-like protein with 3'-5' exonuclease and polymerase domains
MRVIKPSSCIGCREYGSENMELSQGASPCSILILGGSPPGWGGFFTDRSGRIVRGAIEDLVSEEKRDPRYTNRMGPIQAVSKGKRLMYAVHCSAGALDKEIISHCARSMTHGSILKASPKIIFAMGSAPIKSLGIAGSVRKIRGQAMSASIGGSSFTVIPTISPIQLVKDSAGLYEMFKSDMRTAFMEAAAKDNLESVDPEHLRERYDLPKTLEEVESVCDAYSSYSLPGKSIGNTLMALDTETNTLKPWSQEAKIIMVSASVAEKKACAILLNHREAEYDWRKALPHVLKMTMSRHPKGWWNWKYDYQMFKYALMPKLRDLCTSDQYRDNLERVVGVSYETILLKSGVNNTRWDGLLGEHMINEDSKGFYSLKSVVTNYLPEYAGYEESIKEGFNALANEKILGDLSSSVDPVFIASSSELGEPSFSYPRGSSEGEVARLGKVELDRVKKSVSELTKEKNKTPEQKVNLSNLRELRNGIDQWLKSYRKRLRHLKKEAKVYEKEAKMEVKSSQALEGEQTTYEDLDVDLLSLYAAIDADITRSISVMQRVRAYKEDPTRREITGRHNLISLMDRHYLPLTEVLADMQSEGVYLDQEYATSLAEDLQEESLVLEEEIKTQINKDLGIPKEDMVINNPRFLGDVLIGGYGLPRKKETATGQASMTADVLKEYSEEGYEIAGKIVELRKVSKAKSTYVDRLKTLSAEDGRIHGSIHLNGTATGRSSSSSPNLQNTPPSVASRKGKRSIKKLFIPAPVHKESWWGSAYNVGLASKYGWTREDRLIWVDFDFAGAEVRVLTRFAPDEGLIRALRDGLDVHSWMTAEIHGYSYEEVNEGRKVAGSNFVKLRKETKQVVFGTLYGITAQGLHDRMGFEEQWAQEIIDKLMTRFPKIREYINETHKEIMLNKRVSTPYGRVRRFPMVNMDRSIRNKNQRQGVNFLVQSYCSDIVMSCLKNISTMLPEIRGRLLLTVHDSICAEFPESELDNLSSFLERSITQHIEKEFPDIIVPMPYDVLVGVSYGETEDF